MPVHLVIRLAKRMRHVIRTLSSVASPVLQNFYTLFHLRRGTGSSVSIVTDYGLEGRGLNPGADEIFRPSRPALGPTQLPVKSVPGLSRGVEAAVACG